MAAGAAFNTVHFPMLLSTWATDTIKFAVIGNSIIPAKTDSDPRFGAGGAQDYSTAEVSGGNVPAGGTALTGQTLTLSGNVRTANAASPAVNYASNASNPALAYWGIYYNVTQSNKVVRVVDLGGPLSLVPGWQENFNSTGSGTQPVSTATNN